MAQLMPLPLTVSCFRKIQIGFTFLVPAHPGSPGKRAVKRVCVSVCVSVCVYFGSVGQWSLLLLEIGDHHHPPQFLGVWSACCHIMRKIFSRDSSFFCCHLLHPSLFVYVLGVLADGRYYCVFCNVMQIFVIHSTDQRPLNSCVCNADIHGM